MYYKPTKRIEIKHESTTWHMSRMGIDRTDVCTYKKEKTMKIDFICIASANKCEKVKNTKK